jgi:hypothetical protein
MLLVHGHPLLQFPYGCNAKSNNNFEGVGEAQKIIEKRKKERKTREEKERKRESIINRGVCARHYIGWVCAVGVLYIYTPLLSPPPLSHYRVTQQHQQHTSRERVGINNNPHTHTHIPKRERTKKQNNMACNNIRRRFGDFYPESLKRKRKTKPKWVDVIASKRLFY